MKLRSGFVSNSSSSSFIVSVKGGKPIVTLQVEVDLSKYGEEISTKKQLIEYFEDYHGLDSEEKILAEEYTSDNYRTMLSEIEKGNVVIVGSFSSEGDECLEAYLCDTGLQEAKSKNVKIIQSDAGY